MMKLLITVVNYAADTLHGNKMTMHILNQIRLILSYTALYLLIAVVFLIIIMLVASAIMMNGTNNELGRAAEGISAVYIAMVLSFFVISPSVLIAIFYWSKKKSKGKGEFHIED